jgi:hypothetical protein
MKRGRENIPPKFSLYTSSPPLCLLANKLKGKKEEEIEKEKN